MLNRKLVLSLLVFVVLGFLFIGLVGCAGEETPEEGVEEEAAEEEVEGEEPAEDKGAVELLYVEWECATASAYVAKAVLEDLGYEVNVTSVAAPLMYSSLSAGDADFVTTCWLPVTHGEYYEEYEDDLVIAGSNYDGARLAWVVPAYVEIDSIEEINDHIDQFNGEVIGIDPGAGLMVASDKVIEEYGLNINMVEGSDATMVAALKDAISREEWIIVTGWAPHWKFATWDLKMLEDPKGILGSEEQINTVTRVGLEEDMPEVFNFLSKFHWTDAEIGAVMEMNMQGGSPEDNARAWVDSNPDLVKKWIE